MILLENENIKVAIAEKGAELKSLVHKHTKLEYMWSANPKYWAKTSPVLFPLVGTLRNDTYTYKDKLYTLGRHGFARDMVFDYHKISQREVLFTIRDNEHTLLNYPFQFNLSIRYYLTDSGLICSYEIFNPGNEELLFSLGAHPAFAVPLTDQHNYSDYFLAFNQDTEITANKIIENLIANESNKFKLDGGKLTLKYDLFYDDALVFKNLKSDKISILNSKNEHGLHYMFQGFPFFGIWAAKDADFVCLEPWCGIADGINHDGKLENKEGIEKLMPQQNWKRNWEIEIF